MELKGYIRHGALIVFLLTASHTAIAAKQGTDVRLTATIVAAPPCTLPDSMSVNFGNVFTNRIDGGTIKKEVKYVVKCTTTAKISLRIIGNGAAFDNKLLNTSQDGLGIRFLTDGKAFDVNTALPINDVTPPKLEAVLVKAADANLSAGAFSSTATMILEPN